MSPSYSTGQSHRDRMETRLKTHMMCLPLFLLWGNCPLTSLRVVVEAGPLFPPAGVLLGKGRYKFTLLLCTMGRVLAFLLGCTLRFGARLSGTRAPCFAWNTSSELFPVSVSFLPSASESWNSGSGVITKEKPVLQIPSEIQGDWGRSANRLNTVDTPKMYPLASEK